MVFKKEPIFFDRSSLIWLLTILLLPLMGFWHAWLWYFNRIGPSPEEAIGLLVILVLMLGLALTKVYRSKIVYQFSVWPISLLLIVYSLSFALPIPSIIQVGLAFLTLFVTIYWLAFGRQPPISFWALIFIALPVVPSLQFYIGYPARFVSASLTVPLLRLNGIAVSQSGTNLVWQQQLLQFDAPCSGVTMLWAGLFLTLFISFIYRFNFWRTTTALAIACILVLFGNVLRASSLFYLEIGAFKTNPSWLHEAIGVAAFLLVAIAISLTLSHIHSRTKSIEW